MTTSDTYTVYSQTSGEALYSGLSAEAAAREILGQDGRAYELRRERDERGCYTGDWGLYGQRYRQQPLTLLWDGPSPHGRPIWEAAGSEEAAWAKIALRVISADWGSSGGLGVMTDAEWDRLEADLAAGA